MTQVKEIPITEREEKAIFAPFEKRGFTMDQFKKHKNNKRNKEVIRNIKVYCFLLRDITGISSRKISKMIFLTHTTIEKYMAEVRNDDGDLRMYADRLRKEAYEYLR